jgi:UDP-4-amino-4,6-dideoxy-N-acetyl-beta-L-altrosamine transaminase
MIPYGRQDISDADILAVTAVLRSDFLTQGPVVPAFEAAVATACGASFGVATNSATSALHLACLALGVGPGDLVWTSPITFVASANCARYCGADVDFVDIDPRTYNMSPDHFAEKLAAAAQAGRLPTVVIPVHMTGQPCDMAAIADLARQYGVRIIEDASHAIGGRYRGEPIGNGRYSDITVFSFHPVKVITTAEGGVAVTNDERLARTMASYRSHGISRDPAEMAAPPEGPWYYEQTRLGFNYRLTDVQAALGLSQLQRLDDYVATRHRRAARYDTRLAGLPVTVPFQHPDSYSGYHLYVVRLALDRIPHSRREVFDRMRATGIGVNVHYIPVYRQPYYRALGFAPGYCPEAEAYYQDAISLPLFATLTEDDVDTVVRALTSAVA